MLATLRPRKYFFLVLFAHEFNTNIILTKHTRLLLCYSQPGALQIEQSEESDQGKYECVATNNDGTRYSAPANLYVRGGKQPLTTLTIKYYDLILFQIHAESLNCTIAVNTATGETR